MITSENYEEYFLLYVDNELSATERTAVEKFVADNPHLHEEWIALLQCRVHPNQHETFRDKELLLQQDLLSYIDGELDEEGNRAVQEFVGRYPSKAIELQQLLLTVSEPDRSITFPDKERLYRRDRNRRIILLPWVRAGIAAAVIGLVALLLLTTRHGSDPAIVKTPNKKLAPPVTPAVTSPLHSSGNDDHPNGSAAVNATAATTTSTATVATTTTTTRAIAAANSTRVHTPGKGDQRPDLSPITTDNHPSETALVAEIKPDANEKPVVTAATLVAAVNIPKEQSSFATQALLEEAQADETKEMVASAPAGKNKLRGIFRRVSRAFGKTADRDSDGQKEVLISAFQVALK